MIAFRNHHITEWFTHIVIGEDPEMRYWQVSEHHPGTNGRLYIGSSENHQYNGAQYLPYWIVMA